MKRTTLMHEERLLFAIAREAEEGCLRDDMGQLLDIALRYRTMWNALREGVKDNRLQWAKVVRDSRAEPLGHLFDLGRGHADAYTWTLERMKDLQNIHGPVDETPDR